MRALIQRVKDASVVVENKTVGAITDGILIFVGITSGDRDEQIDYLINKIVNLRIFADSDGKLNCSAQELNKELLVVSQFTLYGDCRKGRRPSFTNAAPPEEAKALYDRFVEKCVATGLTTESGQFQAMMDVKFTNHGPVTLILDTP